MKHIKENETKSSFMRGGQRPPAKKKIIVALSIAVFVFALIYAGATLAFIFTDTDDLTNTFIPSSVACEVQETFTDGSNVKSDVSVKNIGDVTSYIRASVVVTWVKADGNGGYVTHSQVPRLNTDFYINEGDDNEYTDYVANENWVKGIDGFWYYLLPVEPQNTTGMLIEECGPIISPHPADSPEGYTLSIEIITTAVQSSPDSAVKEAFVSAVTDVDDNGKLVVIPYSKGETA